MPTRHHYRRPNPDRRRALELLAGSRYGYTKAILRAHGLSIDMMVVISSGLAIAQTVLLVSHEVMGGRPRTPPVRGRSAVNLFAA